MSIRLPLAGVRVLDYAQYVAGPFATMLLADLGADVIKIEPPAGDAWRRYNPLPDAADLSLWFISLNRNKRSVVLDLKSDDGRRASAALIRTADAVIHNAPPPRAIRFGLDRESVRAANPRAVWSCVTGFGTTGPESDRLAYDLIAQAGSGLLLADARVGDAEPRRSGGIAMADLTAGLLTAIAVLAGLAGRADEATAGSASTWSEGPAALGVEVSLLGAALAVQVQRLVQLVPTNGPDPANGQAVDGARLRELAASIERSDELEPYYRCYATADGFVALACLNTAQRLRVGDLLGLTDPWVADPQRPAADTAERYARLGVRRAIADALACAPSEHWEAVFRSAGVPAARVRSLADATTAPQVVANRFVRTIDQPDVGPIRVLGHLFGIDGITPTPGRPAPRLGEHTAEVLASLQRIPA